MKLGRMPSTAAVAAVEAATAVPARKRSFALGITTRPLFFALLAVLGPVATSAGALAVVPAARAAATHLQGVPCTCSCCEAHQKVKVGAFLHRLTASRVEGCLDRCHGSSSEAGTDGVLNLQSFCHSHCPQVGSAGHHHHHQHAARSAGRPAKTARAAHLAPKVVAAAPAAAGPVALAAKGDDEEEAPQADDPEEYEEALAAAAEMEGPEDDEDDEDDEDEEEEKAEKREVALKDHETLVHLAEAQGLHAKAAALSARAAAAEADSAGALANLSDGLKVAQDSTRLIADAKASMAGTAVQAAIFERTATKASQEAQADLKEISQAAQQAAEEAAEAAVAELEERKNLALAWTAERENATIPASDPELLEATQMAAPYISALQQAMDVRGAYEARAKEYSDRAAELDDEAKTLIAQVAIYKQNGESDLAEKGAETVRQLMKDADLAESQALKDSDRAAKITYTLPNYEDNVNKAVVHNLETIRQRRPRNLGAPEEEAAPAPAPQEEAASEEAAPEEPEAEPVAEPEPEPEEEPEVVHEDDENGIDGEEGEDWEWEDVEDE